MRRRKILALKRKEKGKTNYKKRLNLLKSEKPRVVIRKSNNYITLQLVEFDMKNFKETTKVSYNSKKLKDFNWKYSKKNLPACYLAGLAFSLICKKNKIKSVVLDLGLARITKGNKFFSVLLGCIEGGLNLNCSDKLFPSEDRIKGKHISEDMEKEFEITKQKILDYYGR